MPNKSAKAVAEFLEEYVFARYGCPVELVTDQGREFLGEVNQVLTRGLIIHRTTSAYRAQASGLVEHLNGVLGRALAATLDKGDLRTWERGLVDFLTGYRGLRHLSTGKSPHQLLMGRPMRLPWKFHAMPRLMIPDNLSGEEVERYMVCLNESLKVLHGSAREAMLKRQVQNLREYNSQKAVHDQGHAETFFPGDIVWVRNANPRRSKLQQLYSGPYYIHQMVGDYGRAAELSLDGKNFLVRSVEHLCHYHKNLRSAASMVRPLGEPDDVGASEVQAGIDVPFNWSSPMAPEARRQLEKLAADELERHNATMALVEEASVGFFPSGGVDAPALCAADGGVC